MWLYTDLLQALKRERSSSVLSPDGTLMSASVAPHFGEIRKDRERERKKYLDLDVLLNEPMVHFKGGEHLKSSNIRKNL